MKVTLAAYKLLLEIAQAHQGLCAEEIALLKRYRRALGISRKQILEETVTPVTERMIEGSVREREEALLAMARVAHADGRLSPLERNRIVEVADRMDVGRMQIAHLLHQAEEECRSGADSSRHSPRMHATLVVALVITLGFVFYTIQRMQGTVSASDDLQAAAAEHDAALLLLHVSYDLVKGADRQSMEGTGSGFFTSASGRIVTNKHVVQPWKFTAAAMSLIDSGHDLDPDSIVYSAWPVGAQVKGERDGLRFDQAYCSRSGTLTLVGACPDHWVKGRRSLPGGGRHAGHYHALDNNDLAVMQASVDGPVEFIALAATELTIRPLDPIVVLGFPRGMTLLEGDSVVSAPVPGAVRKVEDTILLSAPIYPGNSGGPVLGASGEVIGVAARRVTGSEALGRCIRIEHVRRLLESLR